MRTFCGFLVIATVAALGATGATQTVVVASGDPTVDVPAVQAAVDQGGRVILNGHFSFDAPPTVTEQPQGADMGPAGNVLISKTVAISGTRDGQGEMTSIEGGNNPFYVEAPGSHVTIRGLHFIHSKRTAIHVFAVGGLVIASNRFEGAGAAAISVTTSPNPPLAGDGHPENVSGTLSIANNDIDMQGTADAIVLGIVVWAVGKSPDREVDLHISGNHIRNCTERPLNIYSVGGRAYIERNIITTGSIGFDVPPSGDVIHIVGPGAYLIAHNSIDCAWTSGAHAGIRLQTRAGEPVSRAVVVDNDVNMATPDGTMFDITSAAIEVRGSGEANMVLNNRIRGRANFALSVAAQNGTPQNTVFVMNDLQAFTSAQADLFVDAGGTGTIAVGVQGSVEDHGSGTVVVPVR
jgi:hypothetical protein